MNAVLTKTRFHLGKQLIVIVLQFFAKPDCKNTNVSADPPRADLEKAVSELKSANEELRAKNNQLANELSVLSNKDETAKLIGLLKSQIEALEQTSDRLRAEQKIEVAKLSNMAKERDELVEWNQALTARLKGLESELENTKELIRALENPLIKAGMLEIKAARLLQGTTIQSQDFDRKFLGVIDFEGKHPDSIFNEFGKYGGQLGLSSIWNSISLTGSPIGLNSPNNPISIRPPLIYRNGEVVAALTVNKNYIGHVIIDPAWLRVLHDRMQADYLSWSNQLGESSVRE